MGKHAKVAAKTKKSDGVNDYWDDGDAGDAGDEYGDHVRRRKTPILEGKALRKVFESMRPKVMEQVARTLAKDRVPPTIRIQSYIAAQRSVHVRSSVAALLKGKKWTFVTFLEFSQHLATIASKLFIDLAKKTAGDGPVCFVVDRVGKSSFWVLVMAFLVLAEPEGRALLAARRVALAIDNDGASGGVRAAFQRLMAHAQPGERATLVFMDDAVYSGEQLSYFCGYSMRQWRDLFPNGPAPRIVVTVPFIAVPAIQLFRSYEVRYAVKFPSLFQRRTVAASLAADLFVVRPQILSMFSTFQSFHFEFLGVQPTNTLMLFEHKIADALSIPHRWLYAGPCLPVDVRVAYRVKPELADQLAKAVMSSAADKENNVLFVFAPYGQRAAPPHRDAAMRVIQLMQSPKFRKTYMDRVILAPPPSASSPQRPAFYPLLPPEYCEPRFRKFALRLQQSSGPATVGHVPDCRRPPYKRSNFNEPLRGLHW
jgi:hypothetical protein